MKRYFNLYGSFWSFIQLVEWLIENKVPFIEMVGDDRRGYWGRHRSLRWLEDYGFHNREDYDNMKVIFRDDEMLILAQIAFSDRIVFTPGS